MSRTDEQEELAIDEQVRRMIPHVRTILADTGNRFSAENCTDAYFEQAATTLALIVSREAMALCEAELNLADDR